MLWCCCDAAAAAAVESSEAEEEGARRCSDAADAGVASVLLGEFASAAAAAVLELVPLPVLLLAAGWGAP